MWENMEIDCDLQYECISLMTSAFKINSASPTGRHAEQKIQSVQRRLNIAPHRMRYDDIKECCDTPEKQILQSSEDLSFYEGNTPENTPPDTYMHGELTPESSPVTTPLNIRRRRNLLDDVDPNSLDSGCFSNDAPANIISTQISSTAPTSAFKFIQPSGTAPRKTPAKSSPNDGRMFHSLSGGSSESADDEYLDLFVMDDEDDEDQRIPNDFSSLLSGDIKAVRNSPPDTRRPTARRSLSLCEPSNILHRTRSNLFEQRIIERKPMQVRNDMDNINNTPNTTKSTFKRPEPPSISPSQSKRLKFDTNEENVAPLQSISRPLFKKSISLNDSNHIMTALQRSNTEPNLIGDFSKPYCLPLTDGKHRDLNSISVDTMAALLRGEFNDKVASFKVIDCRYPYEYMGGHIRGAVNMFMQEQILNEFLSSKSDALINNDNNTTPKRNILVFHCEFSSERGPKLSRFLRNNDRMHNTESYPALHYPEIYLLHGGYKDFFAAYPQLCTPNSYRQMLDPMYIEEYKHFRAKTRSWNSGDPKSTASKGSLVRSRSRLVL